MNRNKRRNPFSPYPKGNGPLKILVYGDPGSEKTRRALSMPGPIFMIDMEGGAASYAEIIEGEGHYLSTKSHVEAIEAVDYLLSLPDGAVGTVIVDPIGIIWSSLQNSHVQREVRKKGVPPEEADFNVSVWGKLKRVHGDFLSKLLTAPFHVVLTARGKDKIDGRGKNIGYGPECEKTVPYLVNIVIESRDRGDVVLKDRTGTFRERHSTDKGERVPYTAFLDKAGRRQPEIQTDSDAADEAATGEDWLDDRDHFLTALQGVSVSYDQVVALCRAMNRPEPAKMDNASRRKLIGYLKTPGGLEDVRKANEGSTVNG